MRILWTGFAACVAFAVLFDGTAFGWILRPELSVSEEYTNNFFVVEAEKSSEWTTRLSPALVMAHKTQDILFTGKYYGGASLYARHDEGNRYRQGLALDIGLPGVSRYVRGVQARVTEIAEYSPERHLLPLGDTPDAFFGASLGRVQTFRNRAALNIDARWSPTWASVLIYSNAATRYEGSLLEDRVVHDTSIVQTHWAAHGRRRLTVTYGILNTDYERAGTSWAQRVAIGGHQALGTTLSLDAGAGKSWVQEGFSVVTFNVGMTGPIQRTVLSAYYVRDIEAGEGVSTALGISQRYVLKAAHPLGTRTGLAFKLDHREDDALSGLMTNTRSTGVTTGLTARFSPVLVGSALYTYLDYSEQGATPRDAESHTVAFLLHISPAGWRVAR